MSEGTTVVTHDMLYVLDIAAKGECVWQPFK